MKAIVFTEYGTPDVLKLKEVEKPVPKKNELLVRVHAANVNYGDLRARDFGNISSKDFNMSRVFLFPARIIFGLRKPRIKILGSEFAGEVEATGRDVKDFKTGDKIFGYRAMKMGTNAEYLCMPEKGLVTIKPENMSYEEAAAIPYGSITALNLLRKVKIQNGDKVLINGASGSIGSAAVLLVKYYGAEVTGVCGTPGIEFVKALGADKVIDYTKEDFTQNGETYDLIFDILGKSSFSHSKDSLKKNGKYLLASFKTKQILQMIRTSIFSNKKVVCAMSGENRKDILFVKDLMDKGTIKTIIDRCFPLEETAEAHRYVESGQKRGNVVITLKNNNDT
jgi:NADPH:quinone reductase-like Zn-dependent oxidoreductase